MSTPELSDPEHQRAAIAMIRGFAMDAPARAKSGHQGTAMALAPLAHVLYSRVMKHSPDHPGWFDRDRFVLSNGHASILQYSLLYLCGYGLEIDDLTAFRSWGSSTPGHPEAGHTPGVEVTTGPLGQGFANAVGMAIAERILRQRFGSGLVDHRTYVVVGDGCLMEGISHEAASLAGHLGLGRLIAIFDDNRITIDGTTDLSVSDDVGARFESYGWQVVHLGEIADDCDALERALVAAAADENRPTMLILRSHIGHPSPDHVDSHEAHGLAFGSEDIRRTKEVIGIPDTEFWVDDDTVRIYRDHARRRAAAVVDPWTERSAACADPDWLDCLAGRFPVDPADLPRFEPGTALATRQALQKTLDVATPALVVAGSADLTSNTGVRLPAAEPNSVAVPGGRQLFYGVREHAMGAVMVGIARHGGLFPIGGTFLVFADYMRPAIRLAAMSAARTCFVFTHDSVGVGEDGPTHQPVEQIASLRVVPGLQVIRPADANETAAAWPLILAHPGPTALILSRQAVPVVTAGDAVDGGGAIVFRSAALADDERPDLVIVATGSEVAPAMEAGRRLEEIGHRPTVVSLPSWERFDALDAAGRAAVLPVGVPVLSVEAGSTFGWSHYADRSIGIDRFGASAPGPEVMERLGISVEHIVEVARRMVAP